MLAIGLVSSCGGRGGGGRYSDDYARDDTSPIDEEGMVMASGAAAEEARQAVYEDANASSDGTGADASIVDAFDVYDDENYICTQNCAGHEAGFEWAQQHDVADPSDCGGDSDSFIEGCEAFAEERQQQADQQTQEAAEEAAATAAELAAENYDDSSGGEYETD